MTAGIFRDLSLLAFTFQTGECPLWVESGRSPSARSVDVGVLLNRFGGFHVKLMDFNDLRFQLREPLSAETKTILQRSRRRPINSPLWSQETQAAAKAARRKI